MFLRKSRLEPLPVMMTGVRMGERLLQVGFDSAATITALARKVGMSGTNALATPSEADAERARSASAAGGVFIDVQATPSLRFPFEPGTFDLVVVHSTRGLIAAAAPNERVALLQESFRMLRPGGRVIVIERGKRGGLAALFGSQQEDTHYAAAGGAAGALKAEGFAAVRVIGEAEGYKFTEGVRG